MRLALTTTSVLAIGAMSCGATAGGITMDGFVDAAYGDSEIVVQNTQTNFGDANIGMIDWANGSELDGAYAVIDNDTLYLLFTGNLESNFNKFELFIDSQAGGQNRLRGDNPDVDFNGLNRMGDDGSENGLTFDTGFEADFYVTVTCGDVGEGVFSTFANSAEVLTNGGGTGEFLGGGGAGAGNEIVGPNGIMVALDNSNALGVDGGEGPSDGSGVPTGIEVAIPLSLLGTGDNDIRMCAFINGGGHDFMSNQILAGMGGGPNLGEPRVVDLGLIGGDQFFTLERAGGGCNGDVDGSGDVGFADLLEVLSNWGPCPGCIQDLDGDDAVGFSDLLIVLSSWGPCP